MVVGPGTSRVDTELSYSPTRAKTVLDWCGFTHQRRKPFAPGEISLLQEETRELW